MLVLFFQEEDNQNADENDAELMKSLAKQRQRAIAPAGQIHNFFF